jgi:hypothetical protein
MGGLVNDFCSIKFSYRLALILIIIFMQWLPKFSNLSVHSLAKILCLYHDITLHYVPLNEELAMPDHVRDYVAERGRDSNIVQVRLLLGLAFSQIYLQNKFFLIPERLYQPGGGHQGRGRHLHDPHSAGALPQRGRLRAGQGQIRAHPQGAEGRVPRGGRILPHRWSVV